MPAESVFIGSNRSRQHGFTLIESIIGIVLFGAAIILLSTALFPLFSQSATPHFQARASALGQSLLTEITARQFDHHSDANGGRWRCGENTDAVFVEPPPDGIPSCTEDTALGADSGETSPASFNDIDDFIGCWGTANHCGSRLLGPIGDLVAAPSREYVGFSVDVAVSYDDSLPSVNTQTFKRIDLRVMTDSGEVMSFSALRGNY